MVVIEPYTIRCFTSRPRYKYTIKNLYPNLAWNLGTCYLRTPVCLKPAIGIFHKALSWGSIVNAIGQNDDQDDRRFVSRAAS